MPRERQPHSIAYFCSTTPSPTRTTGSPLKTNGLSTEIVDGSVRPTRNTATAQAGRAGCAASSMTGRPGRHGAGLAGGQFYRRPAWPMAWHGRCARQRAPRRAGGSRPGQIQPAKARQAGGLIAGLPRRSGGTSAEIGGCTAKAGRKPSRGVAVDQSRSLSERIERNRPVA